MSQQETVKQRLLSFLKHEGISHSEFARRLGVSVAYLGAMRKSMPEEKIAKVVSLFPHLNRDWLLYGEGEMLLRKESKPVASELEEYLVPLLPVEAHAGTLQMLSEGVALADCEKIIAPRKGVDFAIRVTGDSMEPQIYGGSVLFIKRINEKAFIPWGHPMVIDTENGVLVKVVRPSQQGKDYIEALSYNSNYPPIQIPLSSLYGIYRVLCQTRATTTL
ncbi:MAG: S24 family peptidase [Muribaculaceae bacterium]|nr:S24 family peptidase [Muribaculaceae bacterium]MDE6754524.1 S24 family peptidase [Muribaculaceae bacterium]